MWAAGLGLSVGLLYCMSLAARQTIALCYVRQKPVPAGAEKAAAWDPGNPRYPAALGRFYQRSLAAADLQKAIFWYEKATRLSPHRAHYWADLAAAYELAGRITEAGRAYERTRQLSPHSAQVNWRLANFYLRQGQLGEAREGLRKAIAGDPNLQRPSFDLAWRAGIPADRILITMIPADSGIYLHYLRYLVHTDRLDEGSKVWNRLLDLNLPFQLRSSFFYLHALIREQRVDELISAWAALRKRYPRWIRPRVQDGTLIPNGDFETEILNGGLGWRVRPIDGAVVRVDSSVSLDGSQSLRIEFNGERNLDYRHVFHYLPVRPNTPYRLVGYLRSRSITTDSGPRFEVLDAYAPSRLFLSTPGVAGTASWSRQQLEFRTDEKTRLLLVRIARPASQKLDNKIAGSVWVDRVGLHAEE